MKKVLTKVIVAALVLGLILPLAGLTPVVKSAEPTSILFSAGQTPYQNNWPYGPNSLIGKYDELKIYSAVQRDFVKGSYVASNVAAQSCDLFSDNFERTAIGSNWTVVDDASGSSWEIRNGQLYQNSNVYRSDKEYDYFQGTNIIAGSASWSDYTFSFDVTPDDNDGVGAIFRYQDKNNYYRFIMVADSTNNGPFRRIDKIVNGQPFQVLAIDKVNSFSTGQKYHVSISAAGSTLKVYMDGKEILSANDSTYKAGKIGLMTYASYAYFDNVCVSSGGTGTGGGTTTPTKPSTGLRAYPGNGKVYLEWDPPADTSNVSGYYLYRSTQSGIYEDPAFDFAIKETNYIDENVENGHTYYYIFKVVYKDGSLSAASNEVTVIPKAPAPVVNITDNQKVTNSSFTFSGKVDVGSIVTVNGKQVSVDSSGNFTAVVTLNKGTNTITIQVTNKAGDTVTIKKTVTYESGSTTPTGRVTIVLQIGNAYMTVNGVKKEIDPGRATVPVIIKGRTLLPIRAIIEEMGGTVDWDGNARKVTIKLRNTTIVLTIDKKQATVNGKTKELDVPPQIINSRTMVPLRFVTEQLGAAVDWNGDTKTVTIKY